MKKIIFLTNMESDYLGMQEAVRTLEGIPDGESRFSLHQLDGTESFTPLWEKEFREASFILVTWMGTGLSCDFLKDASRMMQKERIIHLMKIADSGSDKVDFGLIPAEMEAIRSYFASGGLQNYRSLCSWMLRRFQGLDCQVPEPVAMPWSGIYRPGLENGYLPVDEYRAAYCDPDKPTVGFLFYREDWLWERLDYPNKMIEAIEKEGCNVLAMFTTTMASSQGAISLGQSLRQSFIRDGKPVVDVLLNSFVFSLTVTGMAELKDLQDLQVPILQCYNMYRDYKYWHESMVGLTANEVGYAIAMPEFDGIIHSVPISTNEEREDGTHYRKPLERRMAMLARKARKWAALRHKKNSEKKVAIVFHNFPPDNAHIGSASNLDSIESVRLMLAEMKEAGYVVDNVPDNSQDFIDAITACATNERRYVSEGTWDNADGKLHKDEYRKFYDSLNERNRDQLLKDWGEAPGEVFRHQDDLIVPGMLNGNVYITVQPPRGFGDDPGKIYHSPDCAPTHHYLGFYHWIREVWKADVMLHIGTHGSLEWLPGKGTAMDESCYPDIATGDIPNIYPYWITCVGEGIQAKRRSAACLISYLTAPMSVSGTYEELEELEKLLDEYCHYRIDEEQQEALEKLREMIREKAAECNMDEDVPEAECADFDDYMGRLHLFITDLKNMQISTGLHVLGVPPVEEDLTEYMLALTRLDNGKIPSLAKTLANMHGYEYYDLMENSAAMLPDGTMTYGMLLDRIREESREVIVLLQGHGFDPAYVDEVFTLEWTGRLSPEDREKFRTVLTYVCTDIAPHLLETTLEMRNCLHGMDGGYVDPSPSGAPTSGGADLLPTGRNFYSVDPRTLPTKAAWEIGKGMAEDVVNRFIKEEGHYPESVGIILWATSNLRNHGQCVAEFLALMGMRPVWQPGSQRVVDLEVIPLEELKRPRIDITGRISGLFRDSMPASVTWMDNAVQIIAKLDEPLDMNFVRKHILEETGELEKEGMEPEAAWRQASFRIFGDPPGAHGAGVGAVLETKNWETVDDLAEVYTRWGGHAYGEGSQGTYMPERFKKRMSQIDITVQNVDHRESSMLSSDDYNSYRGGLVAAVRSYKGSMPRNYVSDSSDRSKVQLRTLTEELKRWFRGEAMNPKYIKGMQKHGYKGAGDLATYVAVSFQWDATSEIMEDWMYEKYAEKYALDPAMQEWMKDVNPWALQHITEVLLEARQRGMWNAKAETLQELKELFLSMEGELEDRADME